ncbi:MAG TPA: hypothetical protein VLA61_03435 [Ideonella sp.]|uniref:hypothetical protein n=1 Tax=Ideonella sp. TaxID=1929293 RepID=UPI002B9CF5B7|nr:hypothetical protein [Ideonella sp.]HSI47297.1 hypothetical protein [Ideonella sp.]
MSSQHTTPPVQNPPASPAVTRLLSGLGLAAVPVAAMVAPEAGQLDDAELSRPVVADVGMGTLLRFKSLMAIEGQTVHVARMCYDRQYAFERIANAHTSAFDPLRRVALALFQAYHRREEGRL